MVWLGPIHLSPPSCNKRARSQRLAARPINTSAVADECVRAILTLADVPKINLNGAEARCPAIYKADYLFLFVFTRPYKDVQVQFDYHKMEVFVYTIIATYS